MIGLLLLQILSTISSSPSRDAQVISYSKMGNPDVYVHYDNKTGEVPTGFIPITAKITLQDGRIFVAEVKSGEKIYDSNSVDTYRGWATFKLQGQEIMGFHVFEVCRGDGLVEVAFSISNGTVPYCGGVYYRALEVEYSTRFGVYSKPRFNELVTDRKYTLVSGGNHYFPARFETSRRLVFYKKGLIRFVGDSQLAQRYLNREFSIFNGTYEKYGPLKSSYRMIRVDTQLASEVARLERATREGRADSSVDIQRAPLGPFSLMGYSEPGAVGGTSIRPTVRNNPSQDYARWAILSADLRQDRMPIAAYSSKDGRPMVPSLWAAGTATQGFEYRLTRGIDGIVQIPEFPSSKKFNSGTCAYEYDLVHTFADDEQHLCRYSKLQQDAIWLLNDPLSKHRLEMISADCQIAWTPYGLPPFAKSYDGQWLPFSLKSDLIQARQNPGRGSRVLRSTGWTLDAVSSDIAVTPPGAKRRELLKWAQLMAELVETSVLANGIGTDGRYPLADNGMPWNFYGMSQSYGAAPFFQVPIWVSGIYALAQNVPWDTSELTAKTVLKSADLYTTSPMVESTWGGNAVGPMYYLVVSKNGVPTQSITEGVGKSHWIHCWHHLALAYKLTGDKKYITSMSLVGVPGNDLLKAFANSADRTWQIEAEEVLLALEARQRR